jgi:tetratricopeptide (TPR) repeat protein
MSATSHAAAQIRGQPDGTPRRGWQDGLLALALVLATVLAYQRACHGAFLWDDNLYVSENPLLTAPDGLWRIWFSLDSPSQYFPLTYTTFYLERPFWGLNSAGYHWVNLLLHAANALLVWRLLARLRAPGAWLAAAVFALHPVQVESVAWISERKNVLMAFFFLLALLAWLRFLNEKTTRPGLFYFLALLCYALALAAKTTACTLPAALLLILWLEKIPISWRRLAQVAPFLALGAGMGLVTVWWEGSHQGTQGKLFAIPWLERGLIACRALWFYAGKLLWPENLCFSYPRWTISASDPAAYGWVLATAALGVAVWRGRQWADRGVAAAAAFFAVTLSPVLGFIMLYTFVYSFVADHYQYVACLGPIALAAAAMHWGLARLAKPARWLEPVCCAVLLATLGALTWAQCGQYAGAETLWRATLARNPDSGMAHNNLGNLLLKQGQAVDAIAHLRKALALRPENAETHYNLGNALLEHGDLEEAIAQFRQSLQIQPDFSPVFKNLGLALLRNGDFDGAMACYEKTTVLSPNPVVRWYELGTNFLNYGHWPEAIGCFRQAVSNSPPFAEAWAGLGLACFHNGQSREAVASWQKALEINPALPQVQNHLAAVLATASDDSLRNGLKAVALAEEANQATGGGDPAILRTLAEAYAEAGRYDEAAATARKALSQAQAQKNGKLAAALQEEIKLYEAGRPMRQAKSLSGGAPFIK